MRANEKFRFSLQWRADTAERIQAGELLERLENKKSELVVAAIDEYIQAHPEMLTASEKTQIVVKASIPKEQIEAYIRNILDEKLAGGTLLTRAEPNISDSGSVVSSEDDITEMLKNLDLFAE